MAAQCALAGFITRIGPDDVAISRIGATASLAVEEAMVLSSSARGNVMVRSICHPKEGAGMSRTE
jgi:hypothetical protein